MRLASFAMLLLACATGCVSWHPETPQSPINQVEATVKAASRHLAGLRVTAIRDGRRTRSGRTTVAEFLLSPEDQRFVGVVGDTIAVRGREFRIDWINWKATGSGATLISVAPRVFVAAPDGSMIEASFIIERANNGTEPIR